MFPNAWLVITGLCFLSIVPPSATKARQRGLWVASLKLLDCNIHVCCTSHKVQYYYFEMWGHYSRIMHCIHSWIMASHFIPEILHLLCSQYPSCCNNHPHPPTLHSLLLLHPLHHSRFSLPLSPPLPSPFFPFTPPTSPPHLPFTHPLFPALSLLILHSLPPPFPPSSCSHAYSLPSLAHPIQQVCTHLYLAGRLDLVPAGERMQC